MTQSGHDLNVISALPLPVAPPIRSGPSLAGSKASPAGGGADSEMSSVGTRRKTCEQVHELGTQPITTRRGERVKRKKRRHVGFLAQHFNRPSGWPISTCELLAYAPTPTSRFLLLNQKSPPAGASPVSIWRQEAEFVRHSPGLPVAKVTEAIDLRHIREGYPYVKRER
jgi:hypothetical protein